MSVASINPHDPTDLVGRWPAAGRRAVAETIARAARAATDWRTVSAPARAKALGEAAAALERRADEVVALTVREVGKPLSEARGEVSRGVSILRYYSQLALLPDGQTLPAGDPDALLMARRYPVGVVALLTPWNFPVAIPLWKAAPSLAYGNATILKPSSAAAGVALLLQEIMAPLMPDATFQVILGDAPSARILLEDHRVAAVSFTGSVPVGRDVVRRVAGRGARVQAEMGGQNPSVVLVDADLDRAAATIAYAAMGYAGQKCTATSRVIVEHAVYAEFRERLVAAIEALQVIDPTDQKTVVGPVIHEASRVAALEAVAHAGGRVLTGGQPLDHPGFYMAPTLVELEEASGPLATEEVFAPVVALVQAASAEDAIQTANAVRFGLVASIFTSDLGRALRLTHQLEAGMTRVNAPTSGVDYYAPFGGSKESSFGPREQGLAARDFYTETRTVMVAP
ncbi:MAG: aldehyde dehydrogenase family protein [Actinomycetota bacterium]|nr:aldehyde dehydrogenase family protein [Actinomycetota bacterium]